MSITITTCVLIFKLHFNSIPKSASWEISPQSEEKRAASGFKLRQGEENGSRIYQLVLHEMSLLPSNIPAYNVLPCNNSKPNINENEQTASGSNCDIDHFAKEKKQALPDLESTDNDKGQKKTRMATEHPDIEMTIGDVVM